MKKTLLLIVTCIFLVFFIPVYSVPYAIPDFAGCIGDDYRNHIWNAFFYAARTSLPVGIKSDALGKQKPFIVMGLLFAAAAAVIMYFFPNPAMLFVGNVVSGFSSTMYVAFTVLYAKYYGKMKRAALWVRSAP